uniref:Uncharacterized protein n=1 Tax=Panagrolaimus sp. PS1159 TaxID=55785 RepID=A0AC35GL05_9BILA
MASSRNLVLHVHSLTVIESFSIQTKQETHIVLLDGNITNFFTHLQSGYNLKHIKAIVLTLVGDEFSKFVEFYIFRLKCREFCEKHQIFYLFINYTLFQSCSLIFQTKTMVKEDEKVMVFLLDYPFSLTTLSFIRQKKNYRLVKIFCSKFPPFTQQWQDDMFQSLNPKKIIFSKGPTKCHGLCDLEKAQKFFKSYNPVVVDFEDGLTHITETIANKVLHLMDEKDDPYDVEVPCWEKFEVRYDGKTLIKADDTEIAPFERSVIVNVFPKKSFSMYIPFPTLPEPVEEIKLSESKTKKAKVTLKLDTNSFYDFKVEPFVGEEEEAIANVAEKLCKENIGADKKTIEEAAKKNDKENGERKPALNDSEAVEIDKQVIPEKVQMIFDKQYFSVSYFANGKEYNAYDSDGEAKTPIYIAFTEDKPIIGKTAMEIYSEKPKSVVFDLIKLCSVLTEDICNPKWEFKLSKEEETGDSLVLAFETFEGEKYSTVDFLLAFILKNGKERIKKETGKKFGEIEIKFDGFTPNEILKKNFIEAGKLLKINTVFV